MKNKLLIGTSIAFLLGAGTLVIEDSVEKLPIEKPILESKPVLNSAIDTAIAIEQQTALSKGEMKGGKIESEDGVERTVIPYDGPQGKGYIVEYRKVIPSSVTDKNGSTTDTTQVLYQQIDYGSEGRTQLW